MNEAYYHTEASVKEYIKAAAGFNGKKLIEELNKSLQPNATLLELGTGPGTDYRLLSEKYKVTGSDFSAAFISHLKRAFPTGDFIPLNAATLDLNQRFDAVYSNKVLHHLTDAELMASVKKQAEILNDNGVVCHSFWKGSGAEEFKGMFVNYHDIKEIKRLFSIYFEIVDLREYKEFEVGDSVLLIGRKKPEGPTVM